MTQDAAQDVAPKNSQDVAQNAAQEEVEIDEMQNAVQDAAPNTAQDVPY